MDSSVFETINATGNLFILSLKTAYHTHSLRDQWDGALLERDVGLQSSPDRWLQKAGRRGSSLFLSFLQRG